MKPLHATRSAFPGLGRSKRFFAALTSASLLFGCLGVPAALASDPDPPVGSAEWIAAQTGAISFGYGNIIILLTLNLSQNQNQNQNQAQISNNTNSNNSSSTSKGGNASAAASSSSSSSATGGGAKQQQQQQQAGRPLVVTTPQVFTPPVEVFTPPTSATPHPTTTTCPTCVHVFTPPAVQRGTLPFTGSQLSIFVIIGAVLLLGGAIVRMTGRREDGADGDQPVKRGMSAPTASDPLAMRRRLALEAARLGGMTGGAVDEGHFSAPSKL